MAKICIKCNKKLGFFESIYEGKYCKVCYEEKQKQEREEKKKKEAEIEKKKREEEQARKLLIEKKKKEKINNAKRYLLYTNYYWVILNSIDMMPFHYEDMFYAPIKNKFDIIYKLLIEIINEMPNDFNLDNIKTMTSYRKSAKIIDLALGKHIKRHLDYQKYYNILIQYEKYIQKPNLNILDDKEINSYLLNIEGFKTVENILNTHTNDQIEKISNTQRIIEEFLENSKSPKYDYKKCMEFIEEYKLEQAYQISEIYYFYAIYIIYYIYFNKIVDKIINNSELYDVFSKLKNEIHNDTYIVEKLYQIYESLYQKDYDIVFNNQSEFTALLETINTREKIVEKTDYVDINNSILPSTIDKYLNIIDDNKLYYNIITDIMDNTVIYNSNISIEDVLNIFIYDKTYLKIYNEVKHQQAINERERILNGNFDKEHEINNKEFDYSNIKNGYEFESYIANLYKNLGYTVLNITSKSGDQGADIILEKDSLKFAVQVKYYNNPVGNKAVQEVVAAKSFYKTDRAMVVTNSVFTQQAKTLAEANDVILVDGTDLNQLIKQAKNS